MNRVDNASRRDNSAYRAARRAAARANHPDVGGDAQSLFDALAAVDATFGVAGPRVSHAGGEPARVFVTVSPARRLVKAGSRLLRIQKPRKHYFEI